MRSPGNVAAKARSYQSLKTQRSDDRERPRALGDQLRIERVERNAAKMVGMEM